MTTDDKRVTWQWIAGVALGLITLGSGWWMNILWAEVKGQSVRVDHLKEKDAEQAADIKVIQRDVNEIKDRVKSQDDKLDKIKEALEVIRQNQRMPR